MEKRLKNYLSYMEHLIEEKHFSAEEWQKEKEEHLVQISFFQHERFIHLIVTVTFALLETLSLFLVVFQFSIMSLLLTLLILVLLVPYIRHYYILENGVQKMYTQYDRIVEHMKTKNGEREKK